jgi:type IV pilus assembly protein PilC
MSNSIDIRQLRKASPAGPGTAVPGSKDSVSGNGAPQQGIWGFLNRDIRLFGGALSDKVKEGFYLELSTLLEAGVDIRSALELIMNEQTKKKHKEIFGQIAAAIENGSTLSVALKRKDYFTPYEYYSVQIGEETGKLIVVLKELATYYRKKIKQGQQIIGAMTYPLIVMAVAIGAVSFMMAYVVPMFADVLKRSGGELPLITRMVLNASDAVRQSAGPIALLAVTLIALAISQRNKDYFRDWSARLILRIPVVGGIVRKLYLSRLAGTLSLLIASKIPIVQAIQLVTKMIRFYPIERSLQSVEGDILTGMPLHKSLGRHPIYPPKMISLIKVGEEVNQLELFFTKIADQYTNEVEYQTSILSKFVEPLIIVVLGLVVGVILIAMYLPLFKLGQSF